MMAPKLWWLNAPLPLSEWNPVDAALRILAASEQPMLAVQLSRKLERMALPIAESALEECLAAAAEDNPRLQRDALGRWRLRTERSFA